MSTEFAAHLTAHVNARHRGLRWGDDPGPGDTITSITVNWDEGEQGTSDYGDEYTRLPNLEVNVSFSNGAHRRAEPGWCLEQMLRSAAGLEMNP